MTTHLNNEILIIGRTGFLGSGLVQALPHESLSVKAAGRDLIDLKVLDSNLVINYLKSKKYNYAVICAAITDIETCFRDKDYSEAINVSGTKKLLNILKEMGIRPIFFSSDYVFSGDTKPYVEDSIRRPSTIYGHQKLAIEQYIEINFDQYLIFRTSKLMSKTNHPKNILLPIVRSLADGKPINCFVDQWINPVFIEDIAKIIALAIQQKLNGAFHLGTRQAFTRFELGKLLANSFGFDSSLVQPIKIKDILLSEERPNYNLLNCEKIEKRLNFRFLEIEDSLNELRNLLS